MRLKAIKDGLICALLAVLIGVGVQAFLFIRSAKMAIVESVDIAKQIQRETDKLRQDATLEVRDARKETFAQVALLRKDLTGILRSTEKDVIQIANKAEVDTIALADKRLSGIQLMVDALAQSTDKKLATIGTTLTRVDHIAAQLETTGDLLFDCEENPNCFANRSIGTLQAVEKFAKAGQKTMESVDKATPQIVKNVQDTTAASMEASRNTAATMANLEKQSRPLPLALRFAPQAVQAVLFGIGILK